MNGRTYVSKMVSTFMYCLRLPISEKIYVDIESSNFFLVLIWKRWYRAFQIFISLKEMALALNWCIFNLMLVKPKCVWEAVVFYGKK